MMAANMPLRDSRWRAAAGQSVPRRGIGRNAIVLRRIRQLLVGTNVTYRIDDKLWECRRSLVAGSEIEDDGLRARRDEAFPSERRRRL